MALISGRYTLFTRIPVRVAPDGQVYTGKLWAIDLGEHLRYIDDFHLCCPVEPWTTTTDDDQPVSGLSSDRVIRVRPDHGWAAVVRNFLPTFFIVLQAARRSSIVHDSAAGWPFPLAYFLAPFRRRLPFKLVFVMESSFWMKPEVGPARLRQKVSHAVHSFFVKRLMRQANARIFTQAAYREWCLGNDNRNCLVNEAVWINSEDMAQPDTLEARIAERNGPTRLIFPSRLVREKGVETVLNAIEQAEAALTAAGHLSCLELDIVGEGAMAATVERFVANHPGRAIAVRFLAPISYGPGFFSMLRRYDAALIANLYDEQPRVIYDLFAQGLPCIASATAGIRHMVHEGENALLFPPGDAAVLAERLQAAVGRRTAFADMGRSALQSMTNRTHRAMHALRGQFLADVLG